MYSYGYDDKNLAECLAHALGNVVAMYHKAQGHHWNVMGPDFHEYHGFFGMIYDDVYGSVDELAENMRKIGVLAPSTLAHFAALSSIEDLECGVDPRKMCMDLLAANEVVIEAINEAFSCATEAGEQGIADFLAGRDGMHKKWRWQLTAIVTPVAGSGECSACASMCNCPGAHGGQCSCQPNCGCGACHRMMSY